MFGRFSDNAKTGVPASYCFDVVNEAVIDGSSPTPIFKDVNPWFRECPRPNPNPTLNTAPAYTSNAT